MRHIRGMRDIKTHGTLAREERLVSVARDWHRSGRSGSSENESWDGSVNRMMFKKNAKTRKSSQDLFQTLALERKIRIMRIEQVREFITEMEMFSSEGVPGALAELRRLKTKLSQLESW
ncbi:MAG: hypothetical protein COY85_04675 [Candidatus Portnoybacteria bacterium CG_4_10_14_0_8_um_filter_40_50]|uniref:Uncharacterized protein n=1 Tax=Candidatus Portnoybacteria bacterium CG_4_10_14_0_8_um_filter_40_50 TaxID=1974800 RepID=A0A2M7QNN4_9BACT|nr:MAG: hypothetical protein COY85_04675 [Candidatus Portnoybacteria bacterium CG_4_10_14_0_8_um_filter_40_50]